MSISLAESQTINSLGELFYDFLPGKPHPYADQSLSFPGVAYELGISQFWRSGSKLPALIMLLEKTFEVRRGLFCDLIIGIVRKGMVYRNNKGKPVTREEVQSLNELLLKLHFKIPELWDSAFLNSLPAERPSEREVPETSRNFGDLQKQLLELSELPPRPRGFAFERFLSGVFSAFDLAPRSAFRLIGEQIDGSFQIGTVTYLLEAKWHKEPIGQSDLLIFREKVEGKSTWGRGLFVSHSGFSIDGLAAFARGRPTNLVGMNGQDLYFILEGELSLEQAINMKARRAAETGEFFVPVYNLVRRS